MTALWRQVIVNADDLGLSPGVNAGIRAAHQLGVVTSASLMVRRDAALDAIAVVEDCPDLSIGLHLDLVEYQVEGGEWRPSLERVDLTDLAAVECEIRSQVDRFVDLTGRLPSHLDSHQHCHRQEPVAGAVASVAAELNAPVRAISLPYHGSFYGQYGAGVAYPDGVTTAAFLAAASAGRQGLVEVGCHPAAAVDFTDTYADERLAELAVLLDPTMADQLGRVGIELVNRSGRSRSRAFADRAAR